MKTLLYVLDVWWVWANFITRFQIQAYSTFYFSKLDKFEKSANFQKFKIIPLSKPRIFCLDDTVSWCFWLFHPLFERHAKKLFVILDSKIGASIKENIRAIACTPTLMMRLKLDKIGGDSFNLTVAILN